ncbi:hypothetical protein CAPTEDRAFT_203537 [Capitella teleta]|uniref:Uncharacterized protein n=1 Tax=Capitella teleta TaxID=283909 RepID=R7UKA1_CAPTE|nr:hypothetical protein CAPTEDRAFT_203537 [Capitella teleta]|eukprot:ELU06969.1 hypothetical protein CAPTEDRAFT_203537 [Capitella teleta]
MNLFLVLTIALFVISALGIDMDEMCPWGRKEGPFMENLTIPPNVDHIYFGVKMCKDVEKPLIDFRSPHAHYFIEFGHDLQTAVSIRKNEDQVLWSAEMYVLSCDAIKYFWVKWAHGELSFGRGLEAGTDTIAMVTENDVADPKEVSLSYQTGIAELEEQCEIPMVDVNPALTQ